jgi:hypothetical protein
LAKRKATAAPVLIADSPTEPAEGVPKGAPFSATTESVAAE